MSIKLTIKEMDDECKKVDKVDESQNKIIKSLISEMISNVIVKSMVIKDVGKKSILEEEIKILKDRLENEEEKIDKLEENVEILEDKLEESKNTIINKLDEILNILKGDLNKNCQKMSKHIDSC